MTPDKLGKRDEALQFLLSHETGVLATGPVDSGPRARLVYYACDGSFNVYFLTLKNTRKVSDLSRNPRAAFVVSETDVPRTLQMEGTVTDSTETAEIDPLLTDFVHRLMSHGRYGIPLARFDRSELKFFKFTPSWVRWGDFTLGEGSDTVLTEIHTKDEEEV